MKIKVYPIKSNLHDSNFIKDETTNLFNELKKYNLDLELSSLKNLYDSDLTLILVQSGGSENEFLKLLPELKEPFYLLTFGNNNSLAASLEILSYLKNNKYEGKVLHGDNSYIANEIKNLVNKSKFNLEYKRFGIIGKPSDWLIASNVDYNKVLNKYNIDLIDIEIEEVINNYQNENNILNINYNFKYNKIELAKSLRLAKVLKDIVNRYQLNGLTIRCFDLLNTIKTTACLSLAIFNDSNIISSCEGDIPSLLSMYIINILTNKESFQANPSKIDIAKNEIIFAHCTLPLNMTKSYTLDTHFESNLGVAIRGKLKEEEVTIFKLSNNLVDYFVTTGKIITNLDQNDLCRTQIKIKLDNNIEYFINNPLGNHHIIVYGNYLKEINEFFN